MDIDEYIFINQANYESYKHKFNFPFYPETI